MIVPPRLRVAYLLAVGVGVFAVSAPAVVAGIAVAQVLLAIGVGIGPARLLRLVRKLLTYGGALALTFAFFPDASNPRWTTIVPGITVSLSGLAVAGLMLLRLLAVLIASEVIRQGDPGAVASGLRGFGVPASFADALGLTLGQLAASDAGKGGGRGGGMGAGGGGGRGRRAGGRSFVDAVRPLVRGDVGPLLGEVRMRLEAARRATAEQLGDSPYARDLAVVVGMASAMLALKILKLLPGIPFAPGHKTVLLIPLYILAGALTRMRWGATLTGTTMGTVAFLMGDGRYGVFEILKHVAPGVVVDLLLPLVHRPGRRASTLVWCLFGLVVAAGRFATVLAMTVLVAAPEQLYFLLAVPAAIHLVFGVLSGFIAKHVVAGLGELAAPSEER